MATRRILEFLDGSSVRYIRITHSPAFTAQEVAESVHIPGRYMAKTVVVRVENGFALAVVPATKDADLEALRRQIGASDAKLAEEADFIDRFVGCKLGAAPPFGNLFGIDTYIDRDLARLDEIAFQAGTHTDVILMNTSDYLRLVRPVPVRIAVEPIAKHLHVMSL